MSLRRVQAQVELHLAEGKDCPKEFRIFPAGTYKTLKGAFLFSEKSQKTVMERAADWGNEYPVDYGHSMMSFLQVDPAESGKAAGWFKPAVRDGELWATEVSWTPKAEGMLKAREYRYMSPTWLAEKDGTIVELINVALTNLPASKGLKPLVADRAGEETDEPSEDTHMLKFLIAMLGLDENATEASVQAALMKHQNASKEILTLAGKDNAAEALGVIAAWKQGSEQLPTLQKRVADMEAASKAAELEALITAGQASMKISPALVSWARTQSVESLKAFLAAAAPLAPAQGTASKEPNGDKTVVVLTPEDGKVAQMMGVDPKAVAARKAARGGEIPVGEMQKPA